MCLLLNLVGFSRRAVLDTHRDNLSVPIGFAGVTYVITTLRQPWPVYAEPSGRALKVSRRRRQNQWPECELSRHGRSS